MAQDFADVALLVRRDVRTETELLLAEARLDDFFNAIERAAADEQDVRRIDGDKLLMRVLAAALRRHGSARALENLEECLLDAFARDIARDGRILRLAGNLVNLVDVDDAALRLIDVVVGSLDELQQDVFNIFADIAGLRQRRRVRDGERHVEDARKRLREQRLAAARWADHEDVRLLELDIVILVRLRRIDALVMVVNRDGQRLLRFILTDDVLVEDGADVLRLWNIFEFHLDILAELLFDDLIAKFDAFIADVDAGTGHELAHLVLRLATERAFELSFFFAELQHRTSPLSPRPSLSNSKPSWFLPSFRSSLACPPCPSCA